MARVNGNATVINSSRLVFFLLFATVILIGYLIVRIYSLEKPTGNIFLSWIFNPAAKQNHTIDVGHLPPLGNENAPVKIVEFSDFQCLYCRKFWNETYPRLKQEYLDTGKAVLYYRHYPLSFHSQAQISAESAECANEQGKFWQYHDKVFHKQVQQGEGTIEYTIDDLKRWGKEIGLNTQEFNNCIDSSTLKDGVTQDFNAGTAAGVNGTPTFFINGTALVGTQPYESFKAIIDQELKND